MSNSDQIEQPTDVAFEHINLQVFQLLEDLSAAGQTSSPRGMKTMEANLCTLDLNPHYCTMNFEDRPFNYRYFAGELAWYLRSQPEIDFINNFSSFWKNISVEGKVNSNYGNLLFRKHPVPNRDDDYVNQIEWAFNSLAKDQFTRQAVMFFNTPHFQYEGNKDFVCTMYINFWIRKGYLDMKVQMRSNDIFYGLTYDAPFFSALQQSMWMNLKEIYPDLKLGVYYHCADNIHMYEKHFEVADNILDKPLTSSVKMRLLHPLFRFEKSGEQFTIVTNEEAAAFLKVVEDIVESKFVPKDQDFWKATLGMMFEISQQGETNDWKN
jgi:thymidylate synthase